MTIGQQLLSSLIRSKKGLEDYVHLSLTPDYFAGEYETQLFSLVDAHVRQYGQLPGAEALKTAGYGLTPATEPPAYYADRCRERYLFRRIKSELKHVEDDMNEDQPTQALERMQTLVNNCRLFNQSSRLVDFQRQAHDLIKTEFTATLKGYSGRSTPFGWPTLDKMTGGLRQGEVGVIVGRPAAGKTYMLAWSALHAWQRKGRPLFVSMEMSALDIVQRLAAIYTVKGISGIRHAEMSKTSQQAMMSKLKSLADEQIDHPFYVIDGGLSVSISDVMMYTHMLNPTAVYIDGAYLLRMPGLKAQRWERLTEIVQQAKGELSMALNKPVLMTYQFNREKGKKGVENIAGADAVGQVASLVLGMLQPDSIETLQKRTVEVLKGRDGAMGQFEINWRFDRGPEFMDFSEITEETGDLEYI